MRLSKIKMSGFKSFVDSTVIQFPSDLVGIVGPNGCGKSNIIDAVRWVMGESSRHLRGDSMEDVIFNGSSSRKPVGQASIELSFDNSDGAVGGQYAQYSEIAIRREVARDGQSKYFLNNTRCRRRDVVDIFLGTGLGPRAYAIIEQGMISRLIEAKPEELRVYLEEAAGISKYKERRRETENRIGHTRENLDRLNDLREEVEKQLARLQRQARMAERYKVLKQEERLRKAELLALRWQAMRLEADERQKAVRQQQIRVEEKQAELRAVEAEIEKMRVSHTEANQKFNGVQGRYYKLGSDISRTEQTIQHNKELQLRQQEELEQTQGAWDECKQHIVEDRARLTKLEEDVTTIEKDFESAQAQLSERADKLAEAEQAMAAWQNEVEDVGRRAAKPEQVANVESTRVNHLEQHLDLLGQRETVLSAETDQLSEDGSQDELGALQASTVDARAQVDEQERQLKDNQRLIDERRARIQSLSEELTEAQGRNQDLRGRLASLQALQEAALGKRGKPVTDWLDRNHLAGAPRLAGQLTVAPGWERALETVLGQYLEAVCVEGTDAVIGVLGELKHGDLTLLDTRALGDAAPGDFTPRDTLLGKVKSAWSLDTLLSGIFVADDLGRALTLRETLTPRESVVTKDGIWMSRNWLRVVRDTNERAGVLAREQEIKILSGNLEASEKAATSLTGELSENRDALRELERNRERITEANNRAHRIHAENEAKLGLRRVYVSELESRKVQLNSEYSDIQKQLTLRREEMAEARRLSEQAQRDVDNFHKMRLALARKKDVLARTLHDTRHKTDTQKGVVHELAVRLESQRTALQATQESLARMQAQSAHLERRRESIAKLLAHSGAPIEVQERELKA
ncbi:MAG: chromosome segregation protein SMC, partial [Gammaproteobacteria bacterium]